MPAVHAVPPDPGRGGPEMGQAHVIRGNALTLPLPDSSVNVIVTSPPYFTLRSYQDGGEHYDGQIGAEETPAKFVDALIEATKEMIRVLDRTGSIFVNLGDSYSRYLGDKAGHGQGLNGRADRRYQRSGPKSAPSLWGVSQKSLVGIPWRYALRCIDELGLTLRAEIIWSKTNGMPESVGDRVRRSHENWFHFVKTPRYFSNVDDLREPYDVPEIGSAGTVALGRLPGSVWQTSTQSLKIPDHVAHATCCNGARRKGCTGGITHHAAFPLEWPRRLLAGWCPVGICTVCGQGRRTVTVREDRVLRDTGRVACRCPEPTAPVRPAVVVDPFGGTGTVALVAKALGHEGYSIDMSADYCRIAEWRTSDEQQLLRAACRSPTRAAKRQGQGRGPARRCVPAASLEPLGDNLAA